LTKQQQKKMKELSVFYRHANQTINAGLNLVSLLVNDPYFSTRKESIELV